MRTFEEAADLIGKLYDSEFNGKPHGRFRLANSELALLAGRANIEQSTIDGIKTVLFEKHGLLLIDLRDEVAILKGRILRRYRKASNRIIADVLGISEDPADNEYEDAGDDTI